jgi:hypothetical protein
MLIILQSRILADILSEMMGKIKNQLIKGSMNGYWFKTYLRWGLISLKWSLNNRRARRKKSFILLTHVGLGDQILISGLVNHFLQKNKSVTWFVRDSNLETIKCLTSYHPNLDFVILDDSETAEDAKRKAQELKATTGISILLIGFELVWIAEKIFPSRGLDELFYRMARVSFDNSLLNTSHLPKSIEPPACDFVLIDHFPKTIREIPVSVFNALNQKGLQIVNNPRDTPILALVATIRNAKEIHVVNSALLCLIISMRSEIQNISIYLMGPNILTGKSEYPLSWNEFSLTDQSGNSVDNPIKLDRGYELIRMIKRENTIMRKLAAKILF